MSDSPTWYDVLGVDRTADGEEVRAAWRASIAGLEPGDRRFPTLNRAAEVLLDPAARAAYDAQLPAERSEPEPVDATDPGPDPEPAGGATAVPPGGARTPSTGVPGWLLAALAAAVAIVAGAAATVLAVGGDGDAEESARAARTAAEEAIVPILSYDHRRLEQDRAAARSYLTADYRTQYDKTFSLIEDNAEAVQPVVVAKLVGSGVERAGADRVKVVLFVDQETTNKQTTEPVVYQNYVTVTMQEVDGEWLVDALDTQG